MPLNSTSAHKQLIQSLSQWIAEFTFDPDSEVTFHNWFKCFKETFNVDGFSLNEKSCIHLLISELNTTAFAKYTNLILPQAPWDIGFEKSIKLLMELFNKPVSLFHCHYCCLKIVKDETNDIVTYASIVNKEWKQFILLDLSTNQFKCLIFPCRLHLKADASICTKTLQQMKIHLKLTLCEVGQLSKEAGTTPEASVPTAATAKASQTWSKEDQLNLNRDGRVKNSETILALQQQTTLHCKLPLQHRHKLNIFLFFARQLNKRRDKKNAFEWKSNKIWQQAEKERVIELTWQGMCEL
uniref:DUF7083 domain-containing protein n=1 Tax=Plectus sambesii TaxID=2011161 RepID=A0A914UTI9_9BILA